jgi:segregation and condensation protein A
MDELPRVERDIHLVAARRPDFVREKPHPEVDLREVLLALKDVLKRADMYESHHVEMEHLSTRERMASVLDSLKGREFVPFVSLFSVEEGRPGVVVTFLAVLELLKSSLVELVQHEPFAPIHVKAKAHEEMEEEPAG